MRFLRLGPPPDDTAGGRPSSGPGESTRHTGLRGTAPWHGLQPAEPRGTNTCRVSCRARGILPQGPKGAETEGPAKLQSRRLGLTEGPLTGARRAPQQPRAGTRGGRRCWGRDPRPGTRPTRRALRGSPGHPCSFLPAPAGVPLPRDPGLLATESPGPHPSQGSRGQEGEHPRGTRVDRRGSTPEGLTWTGGGAPQRDSHGQEG